MIRRSQESPRNSHGRIPTPRGKEDREMGVRERLGKGENAWGGKLLSANFGGDPRKTFAEGVRRRHPVEAFRRTLPVPGAKASLETVEE